MSLGNLLKEAREGEWAVGQFNFCTVEQWKGIVEAAVEFDSPLILGTSEGEAGFLGLRAAAGLAKAARSRGVEVFLHLDHGRSLAAVREAVEAGYDSIQIDGSGFAFEKNLKLTKKVVEYVQEKGTPVEGELGVVGGASEIEPEKMTEGTLTDPSRVPEFVKRTGVTSLAVSVGNRHGIQDKPEIDLSLLEEVAEKTRVPLVFHGGSGVATETLRQVLERGVAKVNINTALRREWKKGLEQGLELGSVKPYRVLDRAVKRIEKKTAFYLRTFGSGNKG